ncbi:DgyrCDS5841 [Dimorphilus gyrociliatus]|uniref:DgyrCDS5841 n=1 Tax=Dimorphilus gyrociliatus TaxID=2664684 RepID=A0A7I8VNY8_9ANNE|nr:DgyrCDS5841 [Dimorphilus gyrociliatus]
MTAISPPPPNLDIKSNFRSVKMIDRRRSKAKVCYCRSKFVDESKRPRGPTPWGGKWTRLALPFPVTSRKKRRQRLIAKRVWTPDKEWVELSENKQSTPDLFDSHVEEVEKVTEETSVTFDDSSSEYDTDVEREFKTDDHPSSLTGRNLYDLVCKRFNLPPNSYFRKSIMNKKMRFRHRCMGPKAAKAICITLCANVTIRELDLRDNALGAVGAFYVSEMMKENCFITDLNSAKLVHLNLNRNEFSDKGLSKIADGLRYNTSLKSIDLSWNQFGSKGLINLLDILKNHPSISEIKANFNGIDNKSLLSVTEIIDKQKGNNNLKVIDLSNNRITDNGMNVLAKGLSNSSDLEQMNLARNQIFSNESILGRGLLADVSYIDKLNGEKSKSKLQPIDIKHSGNVRCNGKIRLEHIMGGGLASDEKSDRFEEILGWNHLKSISNQFEKTTIQTLPKSD